MRERYLLTNSRMLHQKMNVYISVSNIEEQLCIVFMYTGNLYHLHDLAIWKWLKKCVHLRCICVWCLDNWFCWAFSMARFKILQLRLTLTPLFTATHAFFFSLTIVFPCPWSVIGVFFFILVTLDLCLLLIYRDLWNSQKWQILISVNRDFDFFYFLRFVTRTPF